MSHGKYRPKTSRQLSRTAGSNIDELVSGMVVNTMTIPQHTHHQIVRGSSSARNGTSLSSTSLTSQVIPPSEVSTQSITSKRLPGVTSTCSLRRKKPHRHGPEPVPTWQQTPEQDTAVSSLFSHLQDSERSFSLLPAVTRANIHPTLLTSLPVGGSHLVVNG